MAGGREDGTGVMLAYPMGGSRGRAAASVTLLLEIPGAEEPGGLRSMGLQGVRLCRVVRAGRGGEERDLQGPHLQLCLWALQEGVQSGGGRCLKP